MRKENDLLIDNKEPFTKELYELGDLLRVKKLSYLQRLVYNKSKNYNTFFIPRKNNQYRKIDEPIGDLKLFQRRINYHFTYRSLVESKNAHGFVRGRSIVTNARCHVKKKILLKLDLKDFFHSIKKKDVLEIFHGLGQIDQVARYLTELCTYEGHLPQGAPTSPLLSNIKCWTLDLRLDGLAKKSGLDYSRYADDLVFSGQKIKKSLYDIIVKVIQEEGFRVNVRKIFWANNKVAQKVTGLYVNDKVSYGRKNYKRLSGMIHNFCVNDILTEKNLAESKYGLEIKHVKRYLYGHIAYLNSIDPEKSRKLKEKLDTIPNSRWDEYNLRERSENKMTIFLDLLETIKDINDSFDDSLLKGRAEELIIITKKVEKQEDLDRLCLILSNYFDRIETSSCLGKKIDNDHKPLNNLREWLNERNYTGDLIVKPIADIKNLASNMTRHKNIGEVNKIILPHGEVSSNIEDYEALAFKLLKGLKSSIVQLRIIFKKERVS